MVSSLAAPQGEFSNREEKISHKTITQQVTICALCYCRGCKSGKPEVLQRVSFGLSAGEAFPNGGLFETATP